MENCLARSRAHVEDGAVALFDVALASNLRRSQMTAANQFGVFAACLLQSCKMLLGNHQYVRGRLRLDVLKGKEVFVFIHFFRRNLAADDAAEKAIAGGICHFFLAIVTIHSCPKVVSRGAKGLAGAEPSQIAYAWPQ